MAGRADNSYESELESSNFGSIKTLLGICAVGLLAIFFLMPVIEDGTDKIVTMAIKNNTDDVVTGSVESEPEVRRYTVRQSVLQSDPSVPCIIYEDGTQEGGC